MQPAGGRLLEGDDQPVDAHYRRRGNRDAQAYVPSARISHFWMVQDVSCLPFNLLVKWSPNGGGKRIGEGWTTGQFIQSLT